MSKCLLTHSISSSLPNNAAKFSHNSIQGHHHSLFGIHYYADTEVLRWAMCTGAMLDPRSPAARYASSMVLKRPIMGCGLLIADKGNTLVIPDMHLPFQHRDSFEFLKMVHDVYECKRVICTGDLVDHHMPSYHESEVDAYSPEEEFELSKKMLKELEEMFPQMLISTGNHDAIPMRKAKSAGMAVSMISDFNKLYDLKGGWDWKDQHFFDDWGSIPHLIPMIINKRHRWVKTI